MTTASPESYSPENRRASSSVESFASTASSCGPSSAAISASSAAISASSSRSADVGLERAEGLRRSCARLWAADVLAANSWSSQKPGACISPSRRATSDSRPAGSKVVREQLQALADLREARGDVLGWAASAMRAAYSVPAAPSQARRRGRRTARQLADEPVAHRRRRRPSSSAPARRLGPSSRPDHSRRTVATRGRRARRPRRPRAAAGRRRAAGRPPPGLVEAPTQPARSAWISTSGVSVATNASRSRR